MSLRPSPRTPQPPFGFSTIELLVVIAIIGLLAAMALPAIGSYIRNYRIRAAADQVAGEVQTARHKAISKNVNLGVAFVVLTPTTYRYVIEDDLTPPVVTVRTQMSTLLNPSNAATYAAQLGPVRTLPSGVQFSTTCTTTPTFAANDSGFRFDRLGAWCDPTGSTEPCPQFGTGQTAVMNTTNAVTVSGVSYPPGSFICLTQPGANLRRIVSVGVGGRIAAQR